MKIYWVIDVLVKGGVKFVCMVFEIASLQCIRDRVEFLYDKSICGLIV